MMSKIFILLLQLLIVFYLPMAYSDNVLTDGAVTSDALAISKDMLQTKIEALDSRDSLDEAAKAKLQSIYQAVQDNLNNIEKYKAQAAVFNASIKQAPEQTKRTQKEIEQTLQKASKQKSEDYSRIPLEELEQRLILEKSRMSNMDERMKRIENELALQSGRPQSIHEEMLTLQQDLDAAQKKLAFPVDKADSKLESEARRMQLKTQIDSHTAELKMLDAEASSNPARVELLKTQLQLLDLKKTALAPVITSIEALIFELRQREAKQMQDALSQTEKEISGKHKLIQETTRENIQYSQSLQDITGKIERYSDQKSKVEAKTVEIDADYKSAEKKISLAGLSPALGKILREQRRNLPVRNEFEQQSQVIQSETAMTSLEQFKVENRLKQLIDVDTVLKTLMDQQVDKTLPTEHRMMIQAELRVLLNNQKDLLNKLSVANSTYLRTLGDLDFARQQMITQAGKFAAYLDERLLWVPSSEPINLNYIAELYHSMQWLLSPSNWLVVIKDALKQFKEHPFLNFMTALFFAGLYLAKKWAKHQLTAISGKVEKIYTDSFYYTLRALIYNIVLVLPLPLLFGYLGWLLTSGFQSDDFTKAIGEGLQGSSLTLFFLQFFCRLFAVQGIARKHFQWQQQTVALLRTQFIWIRFIAVPGMFLISCTSASKFSAHSDSLGRLALMMIMIVLAIFAVRVLRPSKGILRDYLTEYPKSWASKLRYAWYSGAIAVPIVIIGFAAAGYYLSALELQQKLIVTLRLIFLSVIIHAMVFRWLTLVNRQLALANARQKRKAAAAEKHVVAGSEDPILPLDEQQIDIPKINAQTIKLLNVFIGFALVIGFWMIWKNILPAFSFLERIVLWQHSVTVDNQEVYKPVTMINLMLAGLYVFIAIVSMRNFSGVMEILVFRRFPIEAGGRYAVNQLAQYVLFSIGFICVANELGGSWSQVQWLVAALSVGLGFGLQEIFANMVSGIILLFERPIRVGDTVTIGDISGKVSRIQMRATTIIDWDQKELIVPNKTFITDQLVNWTLSDAITRLVIPVGIAYGSDVGLAHKVMLDTVKSMPLVLAEPEPSVLFLGFGDSSLDFSIRIFVSELSSRLPATHDLHMRLEQALREHDIEIPFPQRDIHIRSVVSETNGLSEHEKTDMIAENNGQNA